MLDPVISLPFSGVALSLVSAKKIRSNSHDHIRKNRRPRDSGKGGVGR
jgi:hypothetical protein